jgi:hypothetical protein
MGRVEVKRKGTEGKKPSLEGGVESENGDVVAFRRSSKSDWVALSV